MNKQKPRDTPEIVVPKGYDLTDLIDADDSGHGFEDEAIYTEEVKDFRRSERSLYELPLLLEEKTHKQITLADEPKDEEQPREERTIQRYENALDPRIDEVIRLLSEIVMNTTLDKFMLSGLFNAKIQELENTPKFAKRWTTN